MSETSNGAVEVTDGTVTVGIDIGTSSVKAVAADSAGTVLATARVAHRLITSPEGTFEHDPDQAWRSDVLEAFHLVAEALGQSNGEEVTCDDVEAVCVGAMVPSMAAVDESGMALGPGLLYGDFRGVDETSDPLFPGNGDELVAFLKWHSAHAPGAAGYWPAQAVANQTLCGEGFIDEATAMSSYPLFDLVSWDEGLVSGAGASVHQMPRVVASNEVAGRVAPGLPCEGAVLAAGTIDGLAEQLVAGADEPGDVLVICGTTLITWAVTAEPLSAPGLWTVPHPVAGRNMIGGPSNAGGLFIDRVMHLTGVGALADRSMGGRAAGDGNIGDMDVGALELNDPQTFVDATVVPVWLPYVRGERTPLHRRDLRASLHDAGLDHGPSQVRRAAHEAAAFVVRHHIDLACEAGFVPRRIVATGGGTRSSSLMCALADVTGLPVDVSAIPEGAALGAAYLARCAAGLADRTHGAAAWARIGSRVEPRDAWLEPCGERYRKFLALTSEALAHPRTP